MKARFIEAANYTDADRSASDIWYLVIHDEEAPENKGEAENIANFFAHQPHNNQGTSAHRVVDNKEIIHCVHWTDIAWAAPGANTNGIHWEQSGYVRESKHEWKDPYSLAQLHLLAVDVAGMAKRVGIKPVRLEAKHLRENEAAGRGKHRGICGHDTVTKAFPNIGTHTDPGPNFPWHVFMEAVIRHYERLR